MDKVLITVNAIRDISERPAKDIVILFSRIYTVISIEMDDNKLPLLLASFLV